MRKPVLRVVGRRSQRGLGAFDSGHVDSLGGRGTDGGRNSLLPFRPHHPNNITTWQSMIQSGFCRYAVQLGVETSISS
jgi:hypothetical protein